MVVLTKVTDFLSYLHDKSTNSHSLARQLVVATFSELELQGIFLGFPRLDATPIISEGFVLEESVEDEVIKMISILGPFFRQRSHGDGIVNFSESEILAANGNLEGSRALFPIGFKYTTTLPSTYSETGVLFFKEDPNLNENTESFIRTVCFAIAIYHLSVISNLPNRGSGSSWWGIPGPVGPTGARGAAGATGPKGEAGPTGEAGIMGNVGATGVAGATGNVGATGAVGSRGKKGTPGISSESDGIEALSSRQIVVLSEMRRGKSNRAISDDLDYSESLIRKETIEIFRKLGITGRSALTQDES